MIVFTRYCSQQIEYVPIGQVPCFVVAVLRYVATLQPVMAAVVSVSPILRPLVQHKRLPSLQDRFAVPVAACTSSLAIPASRRLRILADGFMMIEFVEETMMEGLEDYIEVIDRGKMSV